MTSDRRGLVQHHRIVLATAREARKLTVTHSLKDSLGKEVAGSASPCLTTTASGPVVPPTSTL